MVSNSTSEDNESKMDEATTTSNETTSSTEDYLDYRIFVFQ